MLADKLVKPIGTLSSIGLYAACPDPNSVEVNNFNTFFHIDSEVFDEINNENILIIIERLVLIQQKINILELKKYSIMWGNPNSLFSNRALALARFIKMSYLVQSSINFRDCVYLKMPFKIISKIACLPVVLITNIFLLLLTFIDGGLMCIRNQNDITESNIWLRKAYVDAGIDWININKIITHQMAIFSNELERRYALFGHNTTQMVKVNTRYCKAHCFHVVAPEDIESPFNTITSISDSYNATKRSFFSNLYLKIFIHFVHLK